MGFYFARLKLPSRMVIQLKKTGEYNYFSQSAIDLFPDSDIKHGTGNQPIPTKYVDTGKNSNFAYTFYFPFGRLTVDSLKDGRTEMILYPLHGWVPAQVYEKIVAFWTKQTENAPKEQEVTKEIKEGEKETKEKEGPDRATPQEMSQAYERLKRLANSIGFTVRRTPQGIHVTNRDVDYKHIIPVPAADKTWESHAVIPRSWLRDLESAEKALTEWLDRVREKEPWQMTKGEYKSIRKWSSGELHKNWEEDQVNAVRSAYLSGKPVPKDVLNEAGGEAAFAPLPHEMTASEFLAASLRKPGDPIKFTRLVSDSGETYAIITFPTKLEPAGREVEFTVEAWPEVRNEDSKAKQKALQEYMAIPSNRKEGKLANHVWLFNIGNVEKYLGREYLWHNVAIDKALEQGKPIRKDILQEYYGTSKQTSPKYRLTVDENIRRGREAMERVIAEHADVPGAMWREDLGDISFYWGKPGNPEKDFKGGYGVTHIIAKRNAEGEDGEAIARKMVEVIAKGDIRKESGPEEGKRVEIGFENHVAILSKYRFGERETWLLTGWKGAPGEPGEVYGSAKPTHEGPTRFRPSMGAGAKEIISPAGEEGKVTQEMVEAAFPGLEVRRARFFDGYRVLLPHQGLEIAIRLNGDILLPDAAALRAAGYSEEDIRGIQQNAEDYVLAGAWQVIDGGGIITLAKGEGRQTLRHEVFHAAADLVLTDKERQAILKEFGDWEAAARAYETWKPTEKPHSIFQKILDFFRQIWEAFRPTWEGTFRRIERGEVWQRRPREEDVFGEPIRYKVRGTANYEKTGNLPEDFVKTPDGSINFGEVDKEAAQIIRRQAGPVRLQVGKEEARSGFGLIHIKARHEKKILKLGYPNVESFIHDVAANYVQIRKGGGAALLLVKPNGLNKIAAIELTPGEAEDFYTIKSAWLGRPEYIEKFELLWERRVPVAAKPGIAPSLSSFPQGPEKGTPDAEGQSKLSVENIVSPGQKGKTPKYSLRPKEQEAIEAYREKYLAPTEPRESRDVVSTAKGLKDKLVEKAQRFYDQVVDRWAAWERLAERAVRAGAKVPHGEHITNALSFMRGVEGRVRQGLTGEYVYQDRMDFDPDLKEVVFTGDDLVRKGPSFNRRLEPLRELAKRRGQTVDEVMDDFEVFLVAQRDLELAGEFGNRMAGEIKGVHPEESKAVLAALTRKYGDDLRVLMDTGLSLLEWSDEMNLQPLLQVGFIDELTYKAIKAKNQFYAPFKRLLDQTNDYIAAHLAAQGVSSNVIKQIKGSEKQILSPLQTWIELAYKAQWAYARNKVYRAAYITGKAYEDAEVYEVPAKYVPVDFNQKQEIDAQLRQELLDLARELKVDVKVVATLRGRRLGEFSRMLKEEVAEGLISEELAGQIRLRFATSEKTLSHELGHAIDDQYDLVGLLIERGTPEMRRELRRIADQRASEADSKSFKRYVRKKTEQVAEFVNRYITDRETARAVAPETTAVFEQFLNQHDLLRPLLTFRPSARAGLMDFQNRVWARSPLPPEPGCVPYYRDGKRRWLKLPPDLYAAAQNLMPAEMGILMQIARIPADMLRSGAILVPEFSLGRNPIRDIIQAWIFSRFGFNPLKWFRDAYLLISKDPATMEFYRQWESGGGPMATLAESFVEPEKITADYLKGKESQVKYFANPLHALRYASAYLENLTRFSIYKQAREKGLSHAEAIHEARRTTLDFSRAGGHPTVRYLNVTIPFWNASVQGMDKLATELTGPNRKAVARRLAMLAGVSVLIYLLARDDDRYKELEDWERNYFWHLPLGKNAPLLRIPKPFEAGILFGSVAERLVEAMLTKDPKGVKSAMAAAWDAATPEIIPTIARPYIEAKANYDFFRGRPIEDISLQRLPAGLRAKPWTTETAKAVGRLTDISPVQMEHFIRQWTGGLGANYFLPGIDLLLRKTGMVEDIPQPAQDKIQQVWGVRTFFTKPPTGWRAKSVNDFFERYQEVLLADQGWKTLWQSGDKARLEQFLEEHPEAMYARVARKIMDELSKVKKERQQVYASKALTPEQKRVKLEALDARVVELARLGNAFMSTEAAATVKMPPSYRLEQGIRKPWRPEDYYELTARQTYEAFKQFQGRRWQDMDRDDRDTLVETLLRKARREVTYEPKGTGEEDKSSIAGLLVTKKKARDVKDQEASTLHDMLMQKEKRKKAQKFYEIGALL